MEIRLHAHNISIASRDIYFPFASGILSYDCVGCGAKCCKGHGYAIAAGRELERHLRDRPMLPLFVEREPNPHHARTLHVKNAAPGCFYLSADARCEIHATTGYSTKPETCRLFPFNDIRRFGKYLVVGPHHGLCPLQVGPVGTASDLSDHTALTLAMSEHGLAIEVPACLIIEASPDTCVERERQVVALSQSYARSSDYNAFVNAQVEIDQAANGAATMLGLAAQLLGTSPTLDQELAQIFIATTPFIRAQFAFYRSDVAPVHPTRFAHTAVATYIIADAASRAGMRSITFQTISSLLHEHRALIKLIAHLDIPMIWHPSAPIDLPDPSFDRTQFVRLAKALFPRAQAKHPRSIGELLLGHSPSDPFERTLFVKQFAKYVTSRIIHPDANATSRARAAASKFHTAPALGARAHRWLLEHLDEQVLDVAYQRVHRRTPEHAH